MSERPRNTFFNRLLAISFIVIMCIISVMTLCTQATVFSQQENRNLAQKPDWSMASWFDKSFMQDYTSYRNDQFVSRNSWVNLKTKTEMILGKKELNHVYLGDDHVLFEPFKPYDEKQRQHTVEVMNGFAKRHENINFQMMLVPNAVALQADRLPAFVSQANQRKLIKQTKESLTGFTWIDAVKPLQKHRNEYLYYRNDHHWTTLAAKYSFDEFVKVNSIDVSQYPLEKHLISNQFYGTLAARSSYRGGIPDDIYMYVSSNIDDKFTVSYVEEQQKTATLFDEKKLKTNDQYAVFLSGNHPVVEINTASSIDKKLLVIKDSYANCFIPFLTPYYSRIVVVDPRYYAGDIDQLMEDQTISDVLFLFNANTFYQDTSLDVVLSK